MITLSVVQSLHRILIKEFSGGAGVRDMGALQAAIARPYMTFEQTDLYPTAIDKASAILESILINHPFIDGNKRTAYILLRLTLLQFGHDIIATEGEKYDMTIAASKGELKFDDIKLWLSHNTKLA